jgi:hypothetical protein
MPSTVKLQSRKAHELLAAMTPSGFVHDLSPLGKIA